MKPAYLNGRCANYSKRGYHCRRECYDRTMFCEFHQPELTPPPQPAEPLPEFPAKLDSAASIHSLLEKVTLGIATGQVKPRQATAVAYLAQVMLLSLDRMKAEAAPDKRKGDLFREIQESFEQVYAQVASRKAPSAQDATTESLNEKTPEPHRSIQPGASPTLPKSAKKAAPALSASP